MGNVVDFSEVFFFFYVEAEFYLRENKLNQSVVGRWWLAMIPKAVWDSILHKPRLLAASARDEHWQTFA
jgi:hypothetical protein